MLSGMMTSLDLSARKLEAAKLQSAGDRGNSRPDPGLLSCYDERGDVVDVGTSRSRSFEVYLEAARALNIRDKTNFDCDAGVLFSATVPEGLVDLSRIGRLKRVDKGSGTVGNREYAYASTQGHRPEMEDGLLVAEAPAFRPEEAPDVLEEAFEALQEEISERNLQGGAAVVLAHLGMENVLTFLTTGDARLFLLKHSVNRGLWSGTRLTKDQRLYDPLERRRVRTEEREDLQYDNRFRPFIRSRPVGGRLRVPRVLGDLNYPGAGHEPTITQYDLSRETSDGESEVFIVLACDGAFEKRLDEENIADFFTQRYRECEEKPSIGELCEMMPNLGLLSGSKDNISVVLVRISRTPTKPMVAGVFDGHGGNAVPAFAISCLPELLEYAATIDPER
jgi:serine/threonine protein phosphatase PrpC